MACKHKFYDDLELKKIDFKPTILFVGTFNPAWPASNYAEWFYGRTDANYFWEVLPGLFNERSMLCSKPHDWKTFCKRNKLAVTDMIKEITTADMKNDLHKEMLSKYGDDEIVKHFLDGLTPTDINEILTRHTTIQKVYLTRTASGYWGKLWNETKKNARPDVRFVELLTPSRYASYQLSKFRKNNVDVPISLPQFILKRWKEAIEAAG